MDLRELLSSLRASWWIPLVCVLVGAVGASAGSLLMTPEYTAGTQMFVSTTQSASSTDVLTGSQFSQQRVASYARLLSGEELAERVIDELGLDMTPAALASEISASAVADTVLLDVTVTDTSPDRAREIAESVGVQFSRMVTDLETPAGASTSPVKVTVVDEPETPFAPSEPNIVRNGVLASLVGLLMGAFVAVARARLDRSVRDQDVATGLAGAPVVGTIVRDDALARLHVIDRSAGGRTLEDYRQLRTNLQFLSVDDPPKVIMVTSALPSEGKTTVIVNLGLVLADAGRRVTIIEADLRRPKVTHYLGMVGGVGLTNVLAGSAEMGEVIQHYREGNLAVIAAGPTPPNPGELLSSSHMAAIVDKLRAENDYVLVDAPPLLPVADSAGLAPMMDGVLVSVRYGSTRTDQLQEAAATLQRVGARTLGLIMNIVPAKAQSAHAYGYGYDYARSDLDSPAKSSRLHRRRRAT